MKIFNVSFDGVAFVDSRQEADKVIGAKLNESFCDGYNSTARAEGLFPDGVIGVVGGSVDEDDEQGNSDIKVFVSVTLQIEAESADEAESFDPPVALLASLADVLGTVEGECLIGLDREWEVLEVELPEDEEQSVERMS